MMGNWEGELAAEEEQSALESGSCWCIGIFKAVNPKSGILPAQTPQHFSKYLGGAGLAMHRRTMSEGLRGTKGLVLYWYVEILDYILLYCI